MPITRITAQASELTVDDTYVCFCVGDLDQGFGADGSPNVASMDAVLPPAADATDGLVMRVRREFGGRQAVRVFPPDGEVIDGAEGGYVNMTRDGECHTLVAVDDGGTMKWFLHRLAM